MVEEAGGVEDKMNQLNCPLCHEKLYSSIGEGCKLCGMPLEESDDGFCHIGCEDKYKKINRLK